MLDRLRNRLDAGRQSGFTLIELLIVIVILGILAAIVVFAVGGITDRGKKSACKADKKTVEVAMEAYFAKNGSYPTGTDFSNLVPDFLRSVPEATVADQGYRILRNGNEVHASTSASSDTNSCPA